MIRISNSRHPRAQLPRSSVTARSAANFPHGPRSVAPLPYPVHVGAVVQRDSSAISSEAFRKSLSTWLHLRCSPDIILCVCPTRTVYPAAPLSRFTRPEQYQLLVLRGAFGSTRKAARSTQSFQRSAVWQLERSRGPTAPFVSPSKLFEGSCLLALQGVRTRCRLGFEPEWRFDPNPTQLFHTLTAQHLPIPRHALVLTLVSVGCFVLDAGPTVTFQGLRVLLPVSPSPGVGTVTRLLRLLSG